MITYFTFGQIHAHRICNVTVDKDCVLAIEAPTSMEAREKMFELCGDKWSMQYDKLPDMKYFPRGVVSI